GLVGTLRRAPAGAGVEQIPDGVKVAGLQGERDPSGEPGRLSRGAGIVRHEDLPRAAAGNSSVDALGTGRGSRRTPARSSAADSLPESLTSSAAYRRETIR